MSGMQQESAVPVPVFGAQYNLYLNEMTVLLRHHLREGNT
jgi:hypothetical protein